jgi:phospholipid/cholesterol/gamma-HCH transport system substrate-binding protein
MARLVAATCAFLLVSVLAIVYVTSNPGISGTQVKAEFEDTFPLLPGMHVRVYGAVAGSVDDVELTEDGTALVTMQLHEGTDPPSDEATAAIRQQDITGDSYVSLEPGNGPEELDDAVIPTSRTLISPRFDDLLNSFDGPVREGLQLLLVEVGKALERRGEDVNEAALTLRPALEAANEAVAEVRSQNRVLRQLIADAESVTGQAASRSQELGSLVDGLAATLRETAAHAPALDAALEKAPQTAAEARPLLIALREAAIAGRPLAETLAEAAPDLSRAAVLLAPFVEDAKAALDDIGPTLVLTRKLLEAAEPTLEAAPKRVLTAPFDLAAGVGQLLDVLLGEPTLMKALFGADGYGEAPSNEDDVGLGSVGVDPGTHYAGNDPERRFLRAEVVLSCETFGLPIAPGCLLDILAPRRAGAELKARDGRSEEGPAEAGTPGEGLDLPFPDNGGRGIDRALDRVRGLLDRAGGGLGGALEDRPRDGRRPSPRAVDDLLDFLLGS